MDDGPLVGGTLLLPSGRLRHFPLLSPVRSAAAATSAVFAGGGGLASPLFAAATVCFAGRGKELFIVGLFRLGRLGVGLLFQDFRVAARQLLAQDNVLWKLSEPAAGRALFTLGAAFDCKE